MRNRGTELLILGGAQLGLDYGIANRNKRPSVSETSNLIHTAADCGVKFVDTARAYGESEARIGTALTHGAAKQITVITKLSPLNECNDSTEADDVELAVDASIRASLEALKLESLPILMLHRVYHLDAWKGVVWRRLREHQNQGTLGKLGVSVQSPAELIRAANEPEVAFVQMPCNILDARWTYALSQIHDCVSSGSLKVHIRSVFLQGLLLLDDADSWHRAHCDNYKQIRRFLELAAQRCGRAGIADLCLAYMRSFNWVDGIVVGMDSIGQLKENVVFFSNPTLADHELNWIAEERAKLPGVCLDPSRWK